jgi:hypothetical protein
VAGRRLEPSDNPSDPSGNVNSRTILEVRAHDLNTDRQPRRSEPNGSHDHRKVDDADRLQPGELVAVRAGDAVHGNGAGVNVSVLVVRDGGCRGRRAKERVVVAEEVRLGGLQPQAPLRRE